VFLRDGHIACTPTVARVAQGGSRHATGGAPRGGSVPGGSGMPNLLPAG